MSPRSRSAVLARRWQQPWHCSGSSPSPPIAASPPSLELSSAPPNGAAEPELPVAGAAAKHAPACLPIAAARRHGEGGLEASDAGVLLSRKSGALASLAPTGSTRWRAHAPDPLLTGSAKEVINSAATHAASLRRAGPSIEGSCSVADKIEAMQILQEEARAWEQWSDSELATWSPFVSMQQQRTATYLLASPSPLHRAQSSPRHFRATATEHVDTATQSDSMIRRSPSTLALQQRLAYLAARQRCMRRALLQLSWYAAHDALDVACQRDQLRLFRYFLRCWVNIVVVGMRKQANVTAALQHDRKRRFRCSLTLWVGMVVERFQARTATTAASGKTRQRHFTAWHQHAVSSKFCDAQYRYSLLRRSLSRLCIHSAVSIACLDLLERQQLRILSLCLLTWKDLIVYRLQVIHDANEAKDKCLHELRLQHRLDEHAQQIYAKARVRHALLQWHWCTWTVKYQAAHEFAERNSMAKRLCAWYLSKIISGKRVPHKVLQRSHAAQQQQSRGLEDSTEIWSSSRFQSVSRRKPDPALVYLISKQRLGCIESCAPAPPCLVAVGCMPQGRNVCVWQKLLWELRMATVKFGDGDYCMQRLRGVIRGILGPRPVDSGLKKRIGAQVLRARVSLAALDIETSWTR